MSHEKLIYLNASYKVEHRETLETFETPSVDKTHLETEIT